MRSSPPARLARLAGALMAVLVLASCWMPDQFLAEVRLARNGDYALSYKGDLLWAPLAQEIRDKGLSGPELAQKIEVLKRDLSRDEGFKEIQSVGGGRFKVRYEKVGHLGEREQVIFLRRTDALIILETFEDGRAMVRSQPLRPSQRDQILASGLSFSGKLRVVTDARPLRGNPKNATPRGFQRFWIYDWDINLQSERPVLEVDMTHMALPPKEER
ncbi:hypothetical protein [Pararhodospirillum oryzae]|uniref:Lipoprotein n=1 Tax=Pararhodospirillum oryzae TaxID=478448 RepID=A0A512H388_9PROT|nr:hypothetical protein [Pararhodospirillum oryzae]GEO79926.1 hypothetical protein ROR02_00570 [Pararhodospirillum oryzae]